MAAPDSGAAACENSPDWIPRGRPSCHSCAAHPSIPAGFARARVHRRRERRHRMAIRGRARRSLPRTRGGTDALEGRRHRHGGFVTSLARPGGNITGLSTLFVELYGKQLELLKEAFLRLARIAVLGSSTEPSNARAFRSM